MRYDGNNREVPKRKDAAGKAAGNECAATSSFNSDRTTRKPKGQGMMRSCMRQGGGLTARICNWHDAMASRKVTCVKLQSQIRPITDRRYSPKAGFSSSLRVPEAYFPQAHSPLRCKNLDLIAGPRAGRLFQGFTRDWPSGPHGSCITVLTRSRCIARFNRWFDRKTNLLFSCKLAVRRADIVACLRFPPPSFVYVAKLRQHVVLYPSPVGYFPFRLRSAGVCANQLGGLSRYTAHHRYRVRQRDGWCC